MTVDVVKDIVIPVASALFGATLGFGGTRLNDKLNENHERRLALSQIATEVNNATRHYSLSRQENLDIISLADWERVVQLQKCKFYENGLSSFSISSLRLFDEELGTKILDFILLLRNNDFYVDAAIDRHANDPAEFKAVLDELFSRFDITLAAANRVAAGLKRGL